MTITTTFLHGSGSDTLGSYGASVAIGKDGRPTVNLRNYSPSSITGIAITVDLSTESSLAEYRRYYDSVMDDLHDPAIAPGHMTKIPVGYAVGSDHRELTPRVEAILFEDGTAVGQRVWINVLLMRRKRLFQRLSSICDLLNGHARTPQGQGLVAELQA